MKLAYLSNATIPSRSANSVQIMKMCEAFARAGHRVELIVTHRQELPAVPAASPAPSAEPTGTADSASSRAVPSPVAATPDPSTPPAAQPWSFYGVEPLFALHRVRWFQTLPGKSWLYAWMSARKARQLCPDLIYGRNLLAVHAALRMGSRVAFESHSPEFARSPRHRRMAAELVSNPDCLKIVAISEALRQAWIEAFPEAEAKLMAAHDGAELPDSLEKNPAETYPAQKHPASDKLQTEPVQPGLNRFESPSATSPNEGPAAMNRHDDPAAMNPNDDPAAMNRHEGPAAMNRHEGPETMNRSAGSFETRSSPMKVGYLGSLHPGKGMELLEKLARRCPEMHFHIAGGEPAQVADWQKRLSGQSNVTLAGHLPHHQTSQWLSEMDVLVAPYAREVSARKGGVEIGRWMSPLKLFEYMAAGRPVVASDLPVIAEVLTHESDALLASPEDAAQWEQELKRLQADPALRNRLAAQARTNLAAFWTWQKRAERILSAMAPNLEAETADPQRGVPS